jgi:3-oxoadipate enol-lactonase
MPQAFINGVHLHYESYGNGFPLVLAYGLGGNTTQAEASPEGRQRLRQMFLDLNPTGYAHTIRALLNETFPTERLSTLTMPTLVLVGDADPALEAGTCTHQQIPGAHLVILPRAGHLSNLDAPEAFHTSVLGFLRQLQA